MIWSPKGDRAMASPFPGMDPFLEDAEFFPDLHDSLIVHLKESIQAKLPGKYYAITGNRIWLDVARPPVGPDVRIHEKNNGEELNIGGGTSVLTKPLANPVLITIAKEEFRETFVDIYAVQEPGRRLVTSIEVLSPTNKAPRERGHKLFRRKQRELFRNKVHLVEIDLLRRGQAFHDGALEVCPRENRRLRLPCMRASLGSSGRFFYLSHPAGQSPAKNCHSAGL